MKKTLSSLAVFIAAFLAIFLGTFTSQAALDTAKCTGESVEVKTFGELEAALENFASGGTVVLKNDITVTDDAKDCSIDIKNAGVLSLDLNGHDIVVTSKSTKTLFNVTGQAKLYFINRLADRSVILFNTDRSGAAVVRVDHMKAEITNVNVDFTLGSNGYTATADGADSYVFYVNRASRTDIYEGTIRNNMENGNGIYFDANDNNKSKLSVRIGGGATIQANKYCITLDPSKVSYVRFGTCNFESINKDSGAFERILVPSESSATLKTFWNFSDSRTGVYLAGVVTSDSKKIVDLGKKDISASKTCEVLTEAEYYVVLQYAGGHVRLCGTCYMSYDGIEAHTSVSQKGQSATCTLSGKTSGEKCTVCSYSSSKTIPKTGHDMVYYPAKDGGCGTSANKEYYKCNNCKYYFTDKNGINEVRESDVLFPSTHRVAYDAYVAPTCTESGLSAGSHCETCGEIIEKQELIPAKGHSKIKVTDYIAPTCKTEGRSEGSKCEVCELVFEESETIAKLEHRTEIIKGSEASCTKNGISDGEKCLDCKEVVKAQETIPAKGHTEKTLEAKKATCKENGLTEGLVCTACGEVLKAQEPIEKGAHVAETVKGKEASCKQEGLTDGSQCSVCGLVLEKQTVIPKNDNHKETVIKGTAATCTKEGKTDGTKCSVCDKVLQEQTKTDKLAHTEKIVEAVEATCTKTGKTAGIICSVCDTVIKKQETVKKLAHTEKVIKGTDATCTKAGKTDGIKCSVCNEIIEAQQTVEKTGHTVSKSVIRADFDSNGEIVETCAVCKEKISESTIAKIKSVKLSATGYTYNGKAKTPSVTVKNSKGEVLKKGKDYTVTYAKGRKNIGKYAVKVTFIGNYSGEKKLSFSVLPSKTDKITVKQTETAIKLTWNKVSGATGYKVYVYNTKTKKYKGLAVTAKNSYTVKNLKTGTNYKFAVKAYTKTDEGNLWSKVYTEITTSTKPKMPTLKAAAGTNKANLSWQKTDGAYGYVVYMSATKNGEYKKQTATKKLSYTKTNLKKGRTYYFKIRAYKKVDGKNVYSSYSDYKAVKVK